MVLPTVLNTCAFAPVSPDGGQNCGAGSRGERLSAQLRALPRMEEPYDSSSNKELGKCPGLAGLDWKGRADASTWALLRVFQHRQVLRDLGERFSSSWVVQF